MDQRDFRMVKPDIDLQYSSTWKRIASSLEIAKISINGVANLLSYLRKLEKFCHRVFVK